MTLQVAALLAGACFLQPAQASTARESADNPCPPAPSGWVAASSNPSIFGPAQQPGQHHTMVSCQYSQAPKHTVAVVAEYALPDDPNPLADFYFGCNARRQQQWTSGGRTYFVASGARWSYVEFADPGHQLPDASVPPFERVAKVLLTNVSSSAHVCRFNTKTPTLMQHLYLFGFEFIHTTQKLRAFGGVATASKSNPLLPVGQFTTVSEPDATVVTKVSGVDAPAFTVQLVGSGGRHTLNLRLVGGVDFFQEPPVQRLRLRLQVAASDVAACPKGATGTLTIARSELVNTPNAPAEIKVQLCGSLFAGGTNRGTAMIISG